MRILMVEKGLKGTELFKYLIENKAEILLMKRESIKYADAVVGVTSATITDAKLLIVGKAYAATSKDYAYSNDTQAGVLKRTIIANTYNWMDSHEDVHLSGIFNKSIADKGNRIPHLRDHVFSMEAKIGKTESISEQNIPWLDLNINLPGDTQALVATSSISKDMSKKMYKAYLNDEVDQHSVSMQYVKIDMGINDPDYADEYKIFTQHLPKIGNKQKAIDMGYFFAVSEAKLKEYSAVLAGSNELTPTMNQPAKATVYNEPVTTARKMEANEFLKHFKL